ncbi:protein yellow-like [Cloeon dipterum]|uniref:protein yellow-like n=1 Tax=Cloeon dipterum TaxID=197152 RepID=UPI00321FD691
MNPFLCVIILLRLSVATAVNFTQVYKWNELDYEWPLEGKRVQALNDGTFKPENIEPLYMAVYGTRIFLSLEKHIGIPVTLVSLPTSSASSAPTKLTPFPSWDTHKYGNCDKIEKAKGLEVDVVGKLWVLDSGSDHCNSKIWTIDLSNKDHTKLIHRFPFHYLMHDMVIDETPNGTFAFISRMGEQNIVVFSLEKNQSWVLDTKAVKVLSIALSPKNQEPRQLYLSKYDSNELYSISVATLRNGVGTEYRKLIGKWTANKPHRMLMDNRGTMYAAFSGERYISSFDASQPFHEQRFYEAGHIISSFALDSRGTFWMTQFSSAGTKYKYFLLKAAVGAKPYHISDSRTTDVVKYSSTDVSTVPSSPVTLNCTCADRKTKESTNSALIGSLALFLVLSCIFNLWLTLRTRKLQNSNEQYYAGAVELEMPALQNPVSPEMVHEEIENDLYGVLTALASRPRM